jgi:phosphate transport system ATP-binding protein
MNRIEVNNLSISYGDREVVRNLSFDLRPNEILAIIGPAQSGKSSILRCLNRTLDFIPNAKVTGSIAIDAQPHGPSTDVEALRRNIGMVMPLPVGLPLTIYDNVAFSPRCAGVTNRADLDILVEQCLRRAVLWDEVKDRLSMKGNKLSGGQQQRLTLARALSHRPSILCLDEFSIAIDPVTTMRIEEVLRQLRHEMSIIIVTNLTQQAKRLADRTMFLLRGEMVELAHNEVIFSPNPADRRTFDYVNGKFG